MQVGAIVRSNDHEDSPFIPGYDFTLVERNINDEGDIRVRYEKTGTKVQGAKEWFDLIEDGNGIDTTLEERVAKRVVQIIKNGGQE